MYGISDINSDDAYIMILRRCDKFYKRVGFLALRIIFDKNHIYKKVQFEEQGRSQSGHTGSEDLPRPDAFSVDRKHYDWEMSFKEETILLG